MWQHLNVFRLLLDLRYAATPDAPIFWIGVPYADPYISDMEVIHAQDGEEEALPSTEPESD